MGGKRTDLWRLPFSEVNTPTFQEGGFGTVFRILDPVLVERGLTNSEITGRTRLNKGLVSIFMRRLVDWGLMEKEG